MQKQLTLRRILLLFLIALLVFLFAFSAFQLISSLSPSEESDEQTEQKTVSYNGKEYFPRQDLVTFLLMGIDEEGPVKDSGSYNNGGAADLLALITFDETDKSYSILMINRDTVCEMPILGIGGREAGSVTQQIALAHTYGNGLENSCENTVKAVSDLFRGIEIDHYLSINMDAISILTDAVGGVTLEIEEDFSKVDATIPQGETTLNGEQALTFVRSRKDVGDELNTSRLKRHGVFIEAFLKAFDEKMKESERFVPETYNKIADYSVSNLSTTTFSSLLSRYSDYTFDSLVTPKGESDDQSGFMAFYPDKEDLDQITFSLFFSEKKL